MINNKLKRLRSISGYSQKQIADFLQISQPLYSQIEKGNRKIKTEKLERLCNLYCLTLQDFLNNDEEKLAEYLTRWYGNSTYFQ